MGRPLGDSTTAMVDRVAGSGWENLPHGLRRRIILPTHTASGLPPPPRLAKVVENRIIRLPPERVAPRWQESGLGMRKKEKE
jgi:hypothetical protein